MALPVAESDAMLVERAQGGDLDAFSALYTRYFPPVFDFLTRLLRDREEAADVAQDTFIKAMEDLSSLRNPERFKSWVFTIAHRRGLNRIRSSKRNVVPIAPVDDEERSTMALADTDREADPQTVAEAQEAAHMVWEAAAGLDARTYTVLDLHVRQGLESAEIADVLGVSRATAYTMVSRMKRTFSSSLATYMLVNKGARDCARLAAIVPHESRKLTPEVRRRADRHVAHCSNCARNRSALLTPAKLFASLLLVPLPAELAGGLASGTLAASTAAAATAGAAASGAGAASTAGASTSGGAGGAGSFGAFAGVQGWILGVVAALGLAASVMAAVGFFSSGTPSVPTDPPAAAPQPAGDAPAGDDVVIVGGDDGPLAAGEVPSQPPVAIAPDSEESPSEAGVVSGQTPIQASTPSPTTPAPVTVAVTTTTRAPTVPVVPVAVNDHVSTAEDTPITIDVLGNDRGDLDPSTVRITTAPTNGTATILSTGSVRYAPSPGFSGQDGFTYSVADRTGVVTSAVVSISVTPVNGQPIVPGPGPLTVIQGGTVSFDPLAGAHDPDGDTLVVSRYDSRTANGGTVTVGSLVYRPAAGYVGADRFTYDVSDGTISVTVTVQVTVTAAPRPQPPQGGASPVTETQTATTIDLLRGWTDPSGYTLAAQAQPVSAEGGTVERLDNRQVRYTPPPGFVGVDEITYIVSNGHTTVTAVVRVRVEQPNRAPIMLPFAVDTAVSTPVGTLLGAIETRDADGDDVVFDVVDDGPIHIAADGSVVVGSSLFHVADQVVTVRATVRDGNGGVAGADITVTVGAASPPSLGDANFVVWSWMGPGESLGRQPLTDPDDGDWHRFEIVSGSTAGQIELDDASGQFTVAAPVDASHYPMSIDVRVTDAAGLSDTATVTFSYAEPDPQGIDQFRMRPTTIFATPPGGTCGDGPTVSGAAARIARPEAVTRVVLEYRAVVGGATFSGEVIGWVDGDRALANFSIDEDRLGAETQIEVHFTIRVEGSGGTASADGERIVVRRCRA